MRMHLGWARRRRRSCLHETAPWAWLAAAGLWAASGSAATNVFLVEVPDYNWFGGCFGTAAGIVMGYWDRNGFPDFYTGPTAGGVAPMDSFGRNQAIYALWASKAGWDGRPGDKPGHQDDYFIAYDSTDPDPYLTAGRPEHEPDCLGDFIGMSQNKWQNMAGECDGNVDSYCFVYWDQSGARRHNYIPGPEAGLPSLDFASGLLAWTAWRGAEADVFTQFVDFNPTVQAGEGFTYRDLIAEIEAGYPVIAHLQDYTKYSRALPGMARANPVLHAMVIYGYHLDDEGIERVYVRNGWGSSQFDPYRVWDARTWAPTLSGPYPVRGVIAYHPKPRITSIRANGGQLELEWHGPAARLQDVENGVTRSLHWYVVEASTELEAGRFEGITDPSTERTATVPLTAPEGAFFRVRLVPPPAG